ncbi:MAG: porin [Bacteroidetes bacterium]|nr:porin [Bacteroidota bacterium]
MNYIRKLLFLVLTISSTFNLTAQTDTVPLSKIRKEAKETKWYENVAIRGYSQVRYNRLMETNPDLSCEQCDRSWGNNGGFFIRRMRIILFGQISKRVYIYFQPDLASSPSSDRLHFAQIRDAYFDVGLDDKNEFRFRIGQSKVPFGFENMQSSQNRMSLDRNDALNSAVSNERDLGVFFYWAPEKIRKRFSMLVRDGYKGSGDYGVFGFGLYNGQTANNPELNNSQHMVARLSYPFQIKSQIFEPGIQAYTGQFVLAKSNLSTNVKYKKDLNYLDQRLAGTFVLYPRPFGIMAEYNVGQGPEFNKQTDSIETRNLKGGYINVNYMLHLGNHIIFPFVRYTFYDGGKKHEKDARSYTVNEFDFGIEWQPFKSFEIVAMYVISERRFEDFGNQNNFQTGRLLRLQAQVNF